MPNNVGGVSVKVNLDDKDAMTELGKLQKQIEKTNAELNKKRTQRDSVAQEMDKAEASAERARQTVAKLQAELAKASPDARAGIRSKLTAANAELRAETANMDRLNRQWQRLDAAITESEANLAGMTARSGQLKAQIKSSSGFMDKLKGAAAKATKSMQAAFSRLGKMIGRVFLFSVIYSGLRKLREYISDLLMSVPEFRAALSDLKGNLLTALQPILNVLIPATITLVQVLSKAAAVLADVVAKIFGTTAAQSQEAAKALSEQAEAYKETGEEAKKASKQLASFDQLNVLNDDSENKSTTTEGTAPTFDTDFEGLLGDQISGLELLIGEALLVLGAILTFTGANIPLGLGLLALGAASLAAAASENWDAIKSQMQGTIGKIFTIIAAAALVLGAILTFTGASLPLGIALMVIGAAGLATMISLNWDSIRNELQGSLGAIVAIVSAALLVIGAILAFSGAAIPLGIGLMIAGAAGLAAVAAVNWDSIKNALQGPIGAVVAVVSAALLVLGAILTFSGAAIPLGIGLMVAGAAGLAATAAVNWDSIKTALEGPIGKIVAVVSAALLVLGAVLTFSGAAIPLGIGLMIAGAAGLASVAVVNWDSIKNALEGPIGTVTAIVSGALLVLGAILTFTGAAIPLGIGLMIAGAAGLAATVAVNWESIKAALEGPIGTITAIVSGALLVLGAILTFSGAAIPLGIGLMIAGAAGLATVVSLNWDKIRSLLTGEYAWIMALISGALLVLGIILVVVGVIPLGIALIVAGAAGLVTVTALNWDAIKEKIVGIWNSIANWWRTTVAPIFTQQWWAQKFASISEGLKQKVKDGVNAAIDLFNRFIDWINDKLHLEWGSFSLFGVEIIPSGSFQLLTLPRIPRLAEGAVIPPNREFLAVLGDQKNGTNVEAPLETIVAAFRQAIAEMRQSGGGTPPIELRVFLDSKEIKARQQVLSRVTGG